MAVIRAFAPDDRDGLADLMLELQRHYRVPEPPREELLGHLRALPPGVEILVAAQDRDIVGFAALATLFPGAGLRPQLFLKELFVAARARKAGVGRRLVATAARIALERGCRRIDWTTERTNAPARALYESLGAGVVAEKLVYRLEGAALSQLAADAAD
ncbi:GNAT family N-acetyltransferase [Labrys wisconsinensis]|uniref:GNAT superfamily N-acetyltransferase n=1 Tax=Labrys wisconsinensis TaxID=425677 RepID=A0ABU0JAS6_9HYPH|nr:GNAT family N-acetyltransferase [Labrys wisconsinensis]MDQ0471372.1 GNAT superfamily N-acetyltransferase [Labrys wisconsinensis]